jgi:hypothetical protein
VVLSSTPATTIARAARSVVFHLSPFAKGCETAAVNDRRRGLTVHRRPAEALDALFQHIDVNPRRAEVTQMANFDLAIHPIGEPRRPWAFVWDGLSVTEATEALKELHRTHNGGRR